MRCLVVGTSGAGKSTFAQALSKNLKAPYIELDTLYWGPNWTAVPTEQFRHCVSQATQGEHWIADGNYAAVRDVLWSRATHVVWLNYGRWTVFTRVLKRTLARGILRTELFHGNRESMRMAFLSKDSILLWSWSSFRKNQLRFAGLRDNAEYAHLHWSELTHPSQAKTLIESWAAAQLPLAP